MTDLSQYTREWFESHRADRHEYHAMADVIHAWWPADKGREVIDIGCGCAYILERLYALGWDVTGIDGSEHAKLASPEVMRPFIQVLNLNAWNLRYAMPLVVCTEVAEHLEAEHADHLVWNLTRCMAATGALIFTAATPGQGGNGHVNEQPHSYWIDKFRKHHVGIDMHATVELRARFAEAAPRMYWMGLNAMAFGHIEGT